ncbi:MAG: TAXI family TRAP transporter solute-binding subunit [Kineosporiaceae bacterium]
MAEGGVLTSRRAVLAMLGLTAAAASACSRRGADAVAAGPMRIASGQEGGVYFEYGTALAALVTEDLPQLGTRVLETDAGLANLALLGEREAEVAFTLADVAADAFDGGPPFAAPVDLVALARLYDNYLHLVVRRDGSIRTVADLRGRRVSTGPTESGTALVAGRLLEVAGLAGALDDLDLDLEAAADALTRDEVAAFFFSGGIPTPAIAGLCDVVDIRLVPLGDLVGRLADAHGDLYTTAEVPARAYRTDGAVSTVSVPNYLVVRRDMPQELGYALTRLLFTGSATLERAHPAARRLTVRSAVSTYPLDLHPGAADWYRQAPR